MSDRNELHSPIRRAKRGVMTWIETMPKDAQMDAQMALDKLCEVAEREVEQAYFDGNKQHMDSARAQPFRRRVLDSKRQLPERNMDELGQRIINDRAAILERRNRANELEQEAGKLRREANEIERLVELARIEKPSRREDWHYDSQGYCDNPGRGY